MTADRKLIDRVLKLFALAAGTNFTHEADTARTMAEALIAKHNITLPSVKDRTAFDWVRYAPHFKGAKWEYMLASSAAEACGCALFFKEGEELASFTLVGTVADLEACQYLLAMLHEQRMRDWMRAKRKGVPDTFYSFCFSYARGVEANLGARITSHELERRRQAKLWWEAKLNRSIKTVDLRIHGDGRSEAGREAGRAASLHRGNLGGSSEMKKLHDH